jgi:CRISPR type III-A-associated protein Csm2
MDDVVGNVEQNEAVPESAPVEAAAPAETAAAVVEAPKVEAPAQDSKPEPKREPRPPRPDRPPRPANEPRGEPRGGGGGERRGDRPGGDRPGGGGRPGEHRGDQRGDRREGGRPGGGRPFEGPADIELEKLISDSLYLDNQAHAVVVRMRDMDSGTKSQLRRLYNAVRRAVRAPESERQHQFVMLRARLAYTIARHSLRSLDALERLLLQVTRRNDARGYERFKDLFEAIVAYNE